VPLAELLDALDATTEGKVRETILTPHPLQPFDIRNVEPGGVVKDLPEPFTFDATVLRAARVAEGDRRERTRFAEGPLLPPPAGDVSLAELAAFFKDPVKGFFRALDYTLPADVEGVDDAIPVDINALEEWKVGDRMLADMVAGMSPERALNAEWCRGTLPPGQIGWRTARAIRDRVTMLAEEAAAQRTAPARAIDVDIDLGGGRRLTGTVSPVYGDRLVSVTYSKLDGKHLLAAWIPLLALATHDPSGNWTAECIGRRPKGEGARREALRCPETTASDLLGDLVSIYDAGRREPIPLPLKASYAWAQARMGGSDPAYAANLKWKSSDNFPGEDKHPPHARVWKSGAPLKVLLDEPVRPGEEHPGENTRLGAYAARLWLPLLQSLGRS